jgi:hypothetical protein
MTIVYKTSNTLNDRYYIGVHSRNDDLYLGSGTAIKLAVEKYGKENFTRETLFEGTEEECLELEEFIVDEEFILNENNYNLTVGGGMPPRLWGHTHNRGRKHPPRTAESRERYSKAFSGVPKSAEHIANIKTNRKGKGMGKNNAMASAENRAKVGASKIGRKRVYQPDGSFKYLRPEEIS